MSRSFKTVDYDAALDLTVRLGDCLPPDHLAGFVVDSVALLDLSALYTHYGRRGGKPYAPEMLLALILYGYARSVFSSRKIERATYRRMSRCRSAPSRATAIPTTPRSPPSAPPFCRTSVVRAGVSARPGGGGAHGGHDQPGWDQDPLSVSRSTC